MSIQTAAPAVTRWAIDASHTLAEFSAKHLMITTVKGRFADVQGELVLDEADPAASSASLTIATASLETGDPKRDGHLRSADFFDVETFPSMAFRSTRVEPAGGDEYRVTGDLTIRGVTRPVTLAVELDGEARDPWGGTRRSFTAQTKINRKDFGLTWNVALESGGVLVGEQVKVTVYVQAVRQP
jgi:polyisoprenoid-binding protein YceI